MCKLRHVTTLQKMFVLNDMQKIGVGLTGFGLFFMVLGMILFFDGGLLAIGNVLDNPTL